MSHAQPGVERHGLELLPEPEQLFSLTAIAAQVARRQRNLRPGVHYRNARFMHIEPFETAIGSGGPDKVVGLEHKLTAHIRRISPTPEVPKNHWSLRLKISTWSQCREDSSVEAVTTKYKFEWDRDAVFHALRRACQLPATDPMELDNFLDRAYLADDAVDILSAELEMEQVSRADCGQLQADIMSLCSKSGRSEFIAE